MQGPSRGLSGTALITKLQHEDPDGGPATDAAACLVAVANLRRIMLGVGGGLVGFGIILAIACWGFAGPIEDCCREMNDRWPSQPVEPKAQRRLIPLCASSAFTVIRARPSGTDAAP